MLAAAVGADDAVGEWTQRSSQSYRQLVFRLSLGVLSSSCVLSLGSARTAVEYFSAHR